MIPLLRDYSDEEELFDLVLRLLVNLTGPELLLFREELPADKITRNHFIELQTHRQAYKKAFDSNTKVSVSCESGIQNQEIKPAGARAAGGQQADQKWAFRIGGL